MPTRPVAPADPALRLPALLSSGLEQAWKRGLLPAPVLRSNALIDWAAAREGARPKEGSWSEALDRLTEDLRETAALNALGRTVAHGQLTGLLRQRVRAEALWRRHPRILDDSVPAPVVVLGHMRSGTTRLHRLLACDPRFAYSRLHESLWPASRRSRAIAAAAGVRAFLATCNPQLRRIHPTGARAPEEEFGLHAIAFHGAMFEAQWRVPGFATWDETRSLDDVYREFRQLVQLLRWKRGDGPGRIQLLKVPQFMQELEAVLATFPDARIIHIERDLDEVAASSASLVWHQQRIQSDAADPLWVGQEWRRKTRLREERAARALGCNPGTPLLQTSYRAMNGDWRAELARIYGFLGLDLTPRVLAAMTRVATGSAHHGHRYSPEQFGLGGACSDRRENGGRGKD